MKKIYHKWWVQAWNALKWPSLYVLVHDYEFVRLILCVVLFICVLQSEYTHTPTHTPTHSHTHTHKRMFPDSCVSRLCVCLVHSMSGLCPLGRPCVARLCSNRFWQLCNFCWFIPDLGKLFFCSAGVICKTHTHTHTCTHTHAQESNKQNETTTLLTNLLSFTHTPHIFMHTPSSLHMHTHQLTFIHQPPPPSDHTHSHTHAHTWCQ